MEKASKLLKRTLAAGILPLLALGSCISEKEIYPRSVDGDTEITFSIMLPGKSVPASRGMDDEKENKVEYMDILAFEPGGNYVYTARCSGADITTDGGNIRKKTFTVKLRQGTYDLVLLANARDITAVSGMFSGKDKEAALALIEAGGLVGGKWPVDGTRPIPMWGEKSNVTINESTNLTGTNGISLARMVARVDVQITGAAVGKFQLSSVHVYNYNTKGSIAPATGQWDATTDPNIPKATAPNVPASSVLTKGPVTYSGSPVVTATKCESEIYIFEAENHTTAAHTTAKPQLARTCLVIGGYYDGSSTQTYYRVDFSTGSGESPTYLDILRNHQYIFSITKVSGAGYESADIAFESGPVNIEANVLKWNEAEFSDIKFDGQYMLGVRPSSVFDFFKPADTQTAEIKTTHPDGWKVLKITSLNADGITETDISSGGWLTTDKTIGAFYGGNGNYTSLGITVSENTSGSDRTGYIYIKAGKLETRLTVKQSNIVPLSVDVTVNGIPTTEVVFSGTDLGPKTLVVNWFPLDADLFVNVSSVSGGMAFSGTGIPTTEMISGANGTTSYEITSDVFTDNETDPTNGGNPFLEKISKVEFTIINGVNYVSKSVFIKHINYTLTYDVYYAYMLNGRTYNFTVKSNGNWRIKSVTPSATGLLNLQASDNLRTGTAGVSNITTNTPIYFTTADAIANTTGTVAVVFESRDIPKKFDDVSVTLSMTSEFYPPAHSGWAGSNIYWDGSKLTFNDVGVTTNQQAQGVYFQWGSLTGVSPVGTYSTNTSTGTLLYPPSGGTNRGTQWLLIDRANDTSIASNPPSGKSARDRAYLYEIMDGTIGDICKYLTEKGWAPGSPTKKWRMPTSNEFLAANGDYTRIPTNGGFINTLASNAAGLQLYTSGYIKAGIGAPYFPASGNRDSSGGLGSVGLGGYYWSGTPSNTNGYCLDIGASYVNASASNNRSYGFSVRCVAE